MIQELRNEFLSKVHEYIEEDKRALIVSAMEYMERYLEGIKSFDGSDFALHVYRSAIILTEMHSDEVCISAGLVGWIPYHIGEDKYEEIEKLFGKDIVNIVESLHKVSNLKLKGDNEINAINLRKVLVGLSSDVRVIIIKLATRLDNLRYIYTEPTIEQRNKCKETESVLIPIAHRLGINYIKSDLENLCLKYLKPESYKEIEEHLNKAYGDTLELLDTMKSELSEMMKENNIKFRIKSRVKSIHSIYTKLSKGRPWSDIYDVLALRIIVDKVSECYLAIGLIHAKYRPIPKRFKDFIAQPKENMYQSVHTSVIGPNGKLYEIQVRTEEMDEIAEYGIASHWSYKEHGTKAIQNLMEQKLELFRDALETSESDEAAIKDFNQLFVDKMVYVFTPQGDVVELPEKSTPVDFAYRIHSHIGDTLVSAIVNDQIVPIDYELKSDDIVKIVTNESSTPKKEWLKFVKTSQAKNKIKAFFSKQDREEYIQKGEELLIKEIKRRHWNINDTLTNDNINTLVKKLKLKDYDELKLCVGSLRYTANYVMSLIAEEEQNVQDLILEKITSNNKESTIHKNDIIVEGCSDILVTIANCCKPVYGDDIIGYITKGNGIAIHKATCSNIKNMEPRFIDVSWNEKAKGSYTARILIRTNNINNNVLEIVTKCSQRNLALESMKTIEKGNLLDYELSIKVPDTDSLKVFMNDLETLDFVISVERDMK